MSDYMSGQWPAVAIFVVAILLYRRQHVFFSLLKHRFRFPEPTRVERGSMPAQVATLLDAVRPQLEAAGFAWQFTQAAAPFSVFDPRPLVHADIYWHPAHAVLAEVRVADRVSGQAVAVDFTTLFADDTRLQTINRRLWAALAPDLPGYVFEDPYADTLEAQWQAHLRAAARESAARGQAQPPMVDDVAVAAAAVAEGMARLRAHLQATGCIVEAGEGTWRLTVAAAWRYAQRQLRGVAKLRDALKHPYRHGFEPDREALRANEMAGFAISLELAGQPLPRWMKVAMFALTLAASVLLFGRTFSFTVAAALLLVLFVHEMGHLLAMRAYGFRNLSIIFLPFFGAVASGHKVHVKPWQETVILLAGPLPGLVAVLLMSQLPVDGLPPAVADFLRLIFWTSLLLNLFNLLPVGILDGGKLFKLAVLSRFPWMGAVFWTGGALVGLAYAVLHGMIVFAMAMAVLLMGARNHFRAARAISAIRAATGGRAVLGKDEVVARLAKHLTRPEFSDDTAKGRVMRQTVAALAYPRLLQGVPGLSTSLGVLAVHAAAFAVPLLAAAWLMRQPEKPPLLRPLPYAQTEAARQAAEKWKREAAAAREKFLAQYAASSDPQEKWRMLDEADDDDSLVVMGSAWVAQQRDALRLLLPADHPGRLGPVIDAQATQPGPQAEAALLGVIEILGHGDAARIAALDGGRFGTLARAWRALALRGRPQVLAAQDPVLEAVWRELRRREADAAWREQEQWRGPMLAATAARLAYDAGHAARAEEWMTRGAESYTGVRRYAVVARGWLLLDAGDADRALALADEALKTPGLPAYWRTEWLSVAGWAEMSRHDPRAADAWFTQAIRAPEGAAKQDGWFDVATWLLGVINGRPRHREPQITGAMLEHLAALDQYDAPEAARYRASLAACMTPTWKTRIAPALIGTRYTHGWGRLRADTLGKMLDITPVNYGAVE